MTSKVHLSGEVLNQLKKRFNFLEELIESIEHPVMNITVKDRKDMPTGSALDSHYDSGYEYWTNVHEFGNIVVHEYVTDATPKGNPDCELVIYLSDIKMAEYRVFWDDAFANPGPGSGSPFDSYGEFIFEGTKSQLEEKLKTMKEYGNRTVDYEIIVGDENEK